MFTVSSVKQITPSVLVVQLRPRQTKDVILFTPGQYAAIGYKNHGRPSVMRCFSITSTPDTPELHFAVRLVGAFTKSLEQLQPGDTVFVHGPFGNFTLAQNSTQPTVLVAGGIGITPFMSILRDAVKRQRTTPLTLLYSCRSQTEVAFYQELLELEQQNANLRVFFFITDGITGALTAGKVFAGRINKTNFAQLISGNFNQFSYMLCGPKPFMENIRQTLQDNGVMPWSITTEEFTASAQVLQQQKSPFFNLSKWTYGFVATAVLAAISFFSALDLWQTLEKQATNHGTTTATKSMQIASPVNANTQKSSSSEAASNQSTSVPNASAASTTSTSQTTTYQQPISSVS